MSLFIRYANSEYPDILNNEPFVPQTYLHKFTIYGKIIPTYWTPKKVSDYIDTERENLSWMTVLSLYSLSLLTMLCTTTL